MKNILSWMSTITPTSRVLTGVLFVILAFIAFFAGLIIGNQNGIIKYNPINTSTSVANALSSKISFLDGNLYIANLDGTNKTQVYTVTTPYFSWDLSPDGKNIVTSENVIVNVANRAKTTIPAGRGHNWSPDGRFIIYNSSEGIKLMDASGKNDKILINNVNSPTLCRGSNDITHWLPDGKSFVFIDNSGVNIYNLTDNKVINIYDIKKASKDVYSVSVSANGKKVLFISSDKNSSTSNNIYIMSITGSDLIKLTNFTSYENPDAIFSRDGNSVLLTINYDGSPYNGLSIISIEDRNIINLLKYQADGYYPLEVSSDGRYVSFDGSDSSKNTIRSYIWDLIQNKEVSLSFKTKNILWSK